MKKIKKIGLKIHSNKTGNLLPITFDKDLKLKIKRIFFLYGKKNSFRGKHAHKKCTQIFIPVSGKFVLQVQTPKKNKKFILNFKSKTAILVPPKYWCIINFLEKNSVLMVACDQKYDSNDYIRNYKDYKNYFLKR